MSVLWVESCRQSGKLVSEDLFPVVETSEPGTPLMVGRLRRTKSMQPKAFEEDVQNSAGKLILKQQGLICCSDNFMLSWVDLFVVNPVPNAITLLLQKSDLDSYCLNMFGLQIEENEEGKESYKL